MLYKVEERGVLRCDPCKTEDVLKRHGRVVSRRQTLNATSLSGGGRLHNL